MNPNPVITSVYMFKPTNKKCWMTCLTFLCESACGLTWIKLMSCSKSYVLLKDENFQLILKNVHTWVTEQRGKACARFSQRSHQEWEYPAENYFSVRSPHLNSRLSTAHRIARHNGYKTAKCWGRSVLEKRMRLSKCNEGRQQACRVQ